MSQNFGHDFATNTTSGSLLHADGIFCLQVSSKACFLKVNINDPALLTYPAISLKVKGLLSHERARLMYHLKLLQKRCTLE